MKLLLADFVDETRESHLAEHRFSGDGWGQPHHHDFHELFLTFGEPSIHTVNGRRQELQPRSLVYIRPDDTHAMESAGLGVSGLYNLAFPTALMREIHSFLGEHNPLSACELAALPPTKVLEADEYLRLEQRILRLVRIPSAAASVWRSETRALIVLILTEHFAGGGGHGGRPSALPEIPVWLNRLCAEMSEPGNFAAGVPRMTELSGRTPEHLSRTFRRYFQRTPTQWLHDIRLNYAANLLAYSNRDILDIMLECGYENTSHFYRLFKIRHRLSPHRYRERFGSPQILGVSGRA